MGQQQLSFGGSCSYISTCDIYQCGYVGSRLNHNYVYIPFWPLFYGIISLSSIYEIAIANIIIKNQLRSPYRMAGIALAVS